MSFKGKRISRMNARARWTGLAGAGVVALLALSGVSCKKGDVAEPTSPITVTEFKATADGHAGDSKTGLNGLDVYWTDGDDARVFSDTDDDGKRYVAYGSFGASTIDFKEETSGSGISGNKFYAVYPYDKAGEFSSTNKTVSVTIPAVQTYEAGSFANGANVMAAYTTSNDLAFEYKNVCGVLRLKLTGSATVRTITVRSKNANDKLNGKGTITFDNNGNPSLSFSSGGTAVCLSCPGGVRLTSEGVEFNLVVAKCSMTGGFDVTVVCDEGTFVTSSNHNNPIEAGKILGMPPVHVTPVSHDEDGALPGVFSVSASKKVRFSKGNLYYDENTGQWRFEDSQYDFRTYYDIDVTNTYHGVDACIGGVRCPTPAGQWGLFSWSTDAVSNNWGMYIGNATDADPDCYTGNFKNWGKKSIANGGNDEGLWNTPTRAEYTYLFQTRNGGNNTEWARYAKATVNGVQGLLVFPDEVVAIIGESATTATVGDVPIVNVNNSDTGYSLNKFGAAEWACLESAGCMFLPCAGNCYGTTAENIGSGGLYWTSTASGYSDSAYAMDFYASSVNHIYYKYRWYRRAVRLIRDM